MNNSTPGAHVIQIFVKKYATDEEYKYLTHTEGKTSSQVTSMTTGIFGLKEISTCKNLENKFSAPNALEFRGWSKF